MAYITQEDKKELSIPIKAVLKKYNVKGTISIQHYCKLIVKIKSGIFKFEGLKAIPAYGTLTFYHGSHKCCSEQENKFLKELHAVMNKGNYDNSNVYQDYHDVGWYTQIQLGDYDKPYVAIAA